MVGGIGTARISNFVLGSSATLIIDVVSGEQPGSGCDLISTRTTTIHGGTILVRWAKDFIPAVDQEFTFLTASDRLTLNKMPAIAIEQPGLSEQFGLTVEVVSNRMYLKVYSKQTEGTP